MAGPVTAEIATSGSQCDALLDLPPGGERVLYLQAGFHQKTGTQTYYVNFTIRPYDGPRSYSAVASPAGPDQPPAAPRELKSGATMWVSAFSDTVADHQDWSPTSGKVVVDSAEADMMNGSIDAVLQREASHGNAAPNGPVHLSGAWSCRYLIDPQRHL